MGIWLVKTFRELWLKRQRRVREEKFLKAKLENELYWTGWWDHSPEIAQSGPWRGFAQDLAEHPISPEKTS